MKETLQNSGISILKGIAISYAITLILLFIYAVLLNFTNIQEETMAPVIIVITGVSILVRKFNTVQEK